jgi:hypothetical protein
VYTGTFPSGIYHIEQLFRLNKSGVHLALSSAMAGTGRDDYPLEGITFTAQTGDVKP